MKRPDLRASTSRETSSTEPDPVHSSGLPTWRMRVFFDSECPLCAREVAWMRRRDSSSAIDFVNIAAPDFDSTLVGRTHDELMAKIHAQLPGGELVVGAEAIRRMYDELGFRRLVAVSRWPVVRPVIDWGYRVFARNRLRLTGRCDDEHCSPPVRMHGANP